MGRVQTFWWWKFLGCAEGGRGGVWGKRGERKRKRRELCVGKMIFMIIL